MPPNAKLLLITYSASRCAPGSGDVIQGTATGIDFFQIDCGCKPVRTHHFYTDPRFKCTARTQCMAGIAFKELIGMRSPNTECVAVVSAMSP